MHYLFTHFRQDAVDMFNSENPAGSVTSDPFYPRILRFFVSLGFLESLKRLWMGHHLGGRILGKFCVHKDAGCSLGQGMVSSCF